MTKETEIGTAEADLAEAAMVENVTAGTDVEEVEVETEGAADAAIVVVVAAEAAEGEALEDVDSLLKQQELHWS